MNSTPLSAESECKEVKETILSKKLHSGVKMLRERGVLEFTKELSKKCYLEYHANWYICELMKPIANPHYIAGGFRVVDNLFDETISWMVDLHIPGIADPREIDNMRRENLLTYTLMAKDLIVGYINVGKNLVYILDFDQDIHFPPKTAFVIDTFIHEHYRGKKLFHLLISTVKKDLQKKGYEKLYCHIRNDNKTSTSAYENNGFSRIGNISYRKIMGKRLFNLPPASLINQY